MASPKDVGARIIAAQANQCTQLAAELAAARAEGAPAEEIASLEAQEVAARNRYQELVVDMPRSGAAGSRSSGARSWWRFW